MKHYFSRFPTISYNGQLSKNILTRSAFDEATKSNASNFTNLRISDDAALRADIVSENYYGSPYYDWLYYMSNAIIDPYNDMFLDSDSFQKFINKKYGNVQFANEKILFYINNWADSSDDKLTVAQYEAAALEVKKYYTGTIDYNNRVTGYVRHSLDWIKSTNKLRILTLDTVTLMTVGTIVIQYVSGSIVAKGEVVDVNDVDLKITVKNITGGFVTTGGNTIKRYNTTETYVVSTIDTPHTTDNIPTIESAYWTPMTAYAFEQEKNEAKRNIKLLRSSLRGSAEQQLDDTMRE